MKRPYAAGVYEQDSDGWRPVEWSRHSAPELAQRAARKYRRERLQDGSATGGLYSWSSWYTDGAGQGIEVGANAEGCER